MNERERNTMKVKLKNVLPNPFRDMDNYPIHPQKIELLKKSIESTEFWENVVARDAGNGKIELAYGHHRLTALREIYGPNTEFNWIVRDLDDEEMLKIMADENAQEWGHVSDVERETVRAVVKAYSEDKIGLNKPPADTPKSKTRFAPSFCYGVPSTDAVERPYTIDTILSFLNGTMSHRTVQYTLQALCLIEQGHLKEKQVTGLSTNEMRTVVDETIRAVKQAEAITKETERKAKVAPTPTLAKQIKDDGKKKAKAVVTKTASAVSSVMQAGDGATAAKAAGTTARVNVLGTAEKELPEINKAASGVASQLLRLLDPDYTPGSKLEELIKHRQHLSGQSIQSLQSSLDIVIEYAEGYKARL
jgi:ParB-like chromosome segregation protein Spo0J